MRAVFIPCLSLVVGCVDDFTFDTRPAALGTPQDYVLDETWEPATGQVIDCHGGAIRPRVGGEASLGVSDPDTLIFLGPGVTGVQIRNCSLEATFPIVAFGGGSHEIDHNDITATGVAVWLFSSDQNQIHHNTMRSRVRGVQVRGDSDGTVVSDNEIGFLREGPAVDGSPGWAFPGEAEGIGVGAYVYPGLTNFFVNGRLFQELAFYDTHPDGTQIVNNHFDNEGGLFGVILAARASQAHVEGNIIEGGALGVAVAGNPEDELYLEPGYCSADPTLRCAEDRRWFRDDSVGCNLPGIGPRGACRDTNWVQGGGGVVDPSFVGNTVSGAEIGFLGGFTAGTIGLVLEANDFEGAGFGTGLVLWGGTLDNGTVVGNKTSGYDVGLDLEDSDSFNFSTLGLELSYNDFGNNLRALDARYVVTDENGEGTIMPFTKPLSMPNNWWGDQPCAFPADSERWPGVVDPSPTAAPIADAWRLGTHNSVARCIRGQRGLASREPIGP